MDIIRIINGITINVIIIIIIMKLNVCKFNFILRTYFNLLYYKIIIIL